MIGAFPQICYSEAGAEESLFRRYSTVESKETLRFTQGDIFGVWFGPITRLGRCLKGERKHE